MSPTIHLKYDYADVFQGMLAQVKLDGEIVIPETLTYKSMLLFFCH